MASRSSLRFAGILAEALGLGCVFGLFHAIAETAFLAWSGIRFTALDLVIFGVVSASGAIALALLVALAAMTPPLRGLIDSARGPVAFRRTLWTILAAAYLLVFLRILYYWSGWGTLLWVLAASPALIFGCLTVFRKGQRALVTSCATALITTTFCALQIVHAEWGNKPEIAGVLSTFVLGPAAVCILGLISLAIAGKKTPAQSPFEPIWRGYLALGLLVAVWAVCWGGPRLAVEGLFQRSAPTSTNASRPNFLLIVLDTVRADHLDFFGYERETMPNLRRFASEECQFADRMFTAAPWTVPSHASMFTGLYSSAHGAHHPFVHDQAPPLVAYPLREDKATLAEHLGSLGYQTAGIVGNFGALSAFGLSRGFAEYDAETGSAGRARDLLWFHRVRFAKLPTLARLIAELLPDVLQPYSVLFSLREPPYRRAGEITDQSIRWLDRNGGRPFFLFLNYFDAHFPYLPAAQDDERFVPRPSGDEWRGFPEERYLARVRGKGEFSDDEKAFLIGQYDAELVGLDREFGRLLNYLNESGFFENTVIFVTTDHGESQFEHGVIDHGNSLYQSEIGGFLLVKTPKSLAAFKPSPTMQFVDFLPTILAILGEPIPPEVQGSPWGAGRDYILSELFCKPGALHEPAEWPDHFRRDRVAVVIGNHKLIRSSHDPDEVYDLAADPAELHPLSDPDPEFLRRAEEIVADRNKRLVEGLSANPEDKTLLDKLRSLGYVQ